uniref:Reverse transcriptase Ty1/copia-type domain-containing protein n=1 Tax=Fagus sylvatica TaxID=28930 RepID=A0A2N9FX54_FAGSY
MRVRILQRSAALTAYEHAPPLDVASTDSVSLNTPTFSIAELQALFNEVLPSSSSASNFALSVTPSISSEWFIDSACCNQMTVNPHLKASYTPPTLLTITIANGSTITVNHYSLTRQIVGTTRKVGQLIELTCLHIPSSSVSALVIAASSFIELWHSRLATPSTSTEPINPTSHESPPTDPTSDDSPLSTPTAKPVNTAASEPHHSHRIGTWHLVDLSSGKSAIGCKRVYKIKTRSDDTVDRYKARLIAKGIHSGPLFQMDVKNVFLNGELTKEVYMQLPPDDMIITGDDVHSIQDLNYFLGQHFEMKDPGSLSFSLFMLASWSPHYAVVLKILRYLKGTLFHGLHFSSQLSFTLQAYSDADWVGYPTNRCFTIGYYFLLGDSLISWCSKKQTVVSHSNTKAEYRALVDTTAKLLWLHWLLQDLGIDCSTAIPIE